MSYARGMGSTATDIAAVAAAAATAASQIIAAASGGASPTATASATIDPATGMPYGAINPATGLPYGAIDPATGLPYGTAPATDYTVPLVIGGLALVGLVGFVVMRRSRTTPNRRRRVRRNSFSAAKAGAWFVPARGPHRFKTKAEADLAKRHFVGDGAFVAKVVKEPSRSRPGQYAYQIYLKATPAYRKILQRM